MQRADLLVSQDREEEALALLGEALQGDPEHVRLLTHYAWVLIRLDRYTEALQFTEQVLSLSPDHSPAEFQRAQALHGLGEIAGAEEAALRGLEQEPEDVSFHLLYARLLATKLGRGKQKKVRRALALSHIDTALELDPENPQTFLRAAQVMRLLKNNDLAGHYIAQGLALAPEHMGLLTERASLAIETVETGGRHDLTTRPTFEMAEANKLLQLDPQHVGARRTMFGGLWYELARFTEGPLALIAVLALSYGGTFVADGDVRVAWPFALVVAIYGGIRIAKASIVSSPASKGVVRALTHETRFAGLRRWLTAFAWCVLAGGTIGLLFVRDSVAIRWIIVALAVAAFASFCASVLTHLAYADAARRFGAFDSDTNSLVRLADERSLLRAQGWFRVIGLVGFWVASFAVANAREDAPSVAFIAVGALLLLLPIAIFALRRFERELRGGLPETTDVLKETYRTPGVLGLAFAGLVGIAAIAILATNIARVPVLPNEYDAIGKYEAHERATTDDDCPASGGRRDTSRLRCLYEKRQDLQQQMEEIAERTNALPELEAPDTSHLG